MAVLTITLQIDAPEGAAQGVKELIAMDMERLGIARVVSIREEAPEQQSLPGWLAGKRPTKPPAAQAQPKSEQAGRYSSELEKALKELYQSGALNDPEERVRMGL